MHFSDVIKQFEEVTVQELSDKIETEDKVIAFLGRDTCSFCRRFAPKLASVSKEKNYHVYFVASDNMVDLPLISQFREDNHIPTVPALLVSKHGSIRRVCDSSLSEQDIISFIEA
ncbi:bacteriocin transport accessory protein [Streptococcus uberis]|nr:bacteriocin transport accessory protein [Streptococcus uberis]